MALKIRGFRGGFLKPKTQAHALTEEEPRMNTNVHESSDAKERHPQQDGSFLRVHSWFVFPAIP
jgi:hypothetical protein